MISNLNAVDGGIRGFLERPVYRKEKMRALTGIAAFQFWINRTFGEKDRCVGLQ
jgi:hypothetical protein